jgi:hypothetical protein
MPGRVDALTVEPGQKGKGDIAEPGCEHAQAESSASIKSHPDETSGHLGGSRRNGLGRGDGTAEKEEMRSCQSVGNIFSAAEDERMRT